MPDTPANRMFDVIFGGGTTSVYEKKMYLCEDHAEDLQQMKALREIPKGVPMSSFQEDDQNYPREGAYCLVCTGHAVVA